MLPEGWQRRPLSECAKFVSGGTPNKDTPEFWGGVFPWITAKDMKSLRLNSTGLTLTDAGKKEARVVPAGSILVLTRGMTLLKDLPICIANMEVAFNQDVKALLPASGIDSDFLASQLIANKQEILGLVDTAGHGTGRLDTDLLKDFVVAIAPPEEQRTIGKILMAWDSAIATTENLLDNSRKQKQALSSQLLTGKRRLAKFKGTRRTKITPHGKIPSDWAYLRIEEIAEEVSEKNTCGKRYPVLSCTKHSGLVDSLSYFSKQVFSNDLSSYKIAPRNTFAYATNHIEEGSIGYQNLYDNGLVSPMYTVFRVTGETHDGFLYRLLKTEHFRQIFEASTNASVDRRGSLRWNQFKKLHVPLPSVKEQVAIACALELADKEISSLKYQIKKLRSEKSALLQQLLTGKRRTKAAKA